MSAPSTAAIAVVVVSHQSAATLDDCLVRLRAAQAVAAVVVVDNASRDASCAIAQRHADADARVRVLRNAGNPGFGAACNQGAADAAAPWLAFVNPDCLVEPDTFARMLELAHGDPTLGLLGADLVDVQGVRDLAARRREPSLWDALCGFGRRSAHAIVPDTAPLQGVDAVSGALMLMPAALFRRLGGFDTGYRLHAEDLDLCRRVRDAGLRVAVANAVRVVHVRGVSSRARPVWVEWQKHRGLWRYFRRYEAAHLPAWRRPLLWCALWAHWLLAAPRAWWRARRAV